jgi:hypothetical protein
MAITTCNLSTPEQRTRVQQLLARYEELGEDSVELRCLAETYATVEIEIGGNEYVFDAHELADVIDRRQACIESQLLKLGINLKAIDDTPSQSPVLDAAIRAMDNTKVTDVGNSNPALDFGVV